MPNRGPELKSRVRPIAEGEVFGLLTVLSKGEDACWCKCACGRRITLRPAELVGWDRKRSCGCVKGGPQRSAAIAEVRA